MQLPQRAHLPKGLHIIDPPKQDARARASASPDEALQHKAQLRGLPRPHGRNCGQMAGFSLHANTFVGPAARDELYKLVKYLCRPSIAGKRVTDQHDGRFRVELKTAWVLRTRRWLITRSSSPGRILVGWLGRWR